MCRLLGAAWSVLGLALGTPAEAIRPMLAAGTHHTLQLSPTGRVAAVGDNSRGQLGDGTTVSRTTWAEVPGLADVIAVAAGQNFSVALKRDGTVWSWGANDDGQLGDGSTTERRQPGQVALGTAASRIAAGTLHALAVARDGSVWAWGSNTYGQLGDGTTAQRNAPVPVAGLTGAIDVAGSLYHSLALLADGSVRGWGANFNGQLGNGSTDWHPTPVAVVGIADATRIAAGGYASYALRADGSVSAWGYNLHYQLGDGTTSDRHAPVTVKTAANADLGCVSDLGAGLVAAYAVRCDGSVVGWGDNYHGQLGRGTTGGADGYAAPTAPVLAGATAVVAAHDAGAVFVLHAPAGSSNYGALAAFGLNTTGQLGDGTNAARNGPVAVVPALPVGQKAGRRTNFAPSGDRSDTLWRRSDGVVVSWETSGDAAASFAPHVLPGVGAGWEALATCDVDGDGRSDVVWFAAASGTVAAWLMADAGTVRRVAYPASVGASAPWSMLGCADVDGDGIDDVVWRHEGSGQVLAWLMRNDATIGATRTLGFAPSSYAFRGFADVDGDWIRDLVWLEAASGYVAIWNMAPWGRGAAWFPGGVGPAAAWDIEATGDFDGDGRDDLIWRHSSGVVAVWYLNRGDVAATQFLASVPPAQWSLQAVGDYLLDHRDDLLWQSPTGQVVRWAMQGRTVQPVASPVAGIGPGWGAVQ